MNGERSQDDGVEIELGFVCKTGSREEEKRAFQAKRITRVKLYRNKSAFKNRILIEWGQIIKGTT